VLPGAFDPEAFAGRETGACVERARRAGILTHEDVHIFGAVGSGLAGPDRLRGDAGEEPRRDHRLAKVVDPAPVVEVAAVESGEDVDMARAEGEVALGGEAAEARPRPGIERERIVPRAGLGIEEDVALADLGEGIALLRKAKQHVRLGRLDLEREDRVPGGERQCLARKLGRLGRRAVEPDLAEAVALARHRADHDPERRRRVALARHLLDRVGGDRVVIAFRAEQADGERLVLSGAGHDHRAVHRLAARILERRELAETAGEADFVEAFEDDRVADRRRAVGIAVGAGFGDRLGLEGGERRKRLGEGRIAERSGFVDRARHRREGRSGRVDRLERLERAGEVWVQIGNGVLELAVGDDRAGGGRRDRRRRCGRSLRTARRRRLRLGARAESKRAPSDRSQQKPGVFQTDPAREESGAALLNNGRKRKA
jgi:hypothetical protein